MQLNKSSKQTSEQKAVNRQVRKSARLKASKKSSSGASQGGIKKNQQKLTNFFSSTSTSFISEPEQPQENEQISLLKKQLKNKQDQIDRIKVQKQVIENKFSLLFLDTKSFKQKSREIIIKNAKLEGERARANKKRIEPRLGYFADGNRNFVEGDDIIEIKKSILEIGEEIEKLGDELKKCKSQEHKDRIKSALSFLKKQLAQKQELKTAKLKQVNAYTAKLRLAYKEMNCYYAEKKWPIVKDSKGNDRYVPLELLGQGGFGQVYKCFDLEEIDYVAIKINHVHFSRMSIQQTENLLKHIKREVKTQVTLKHTNIAEIKQIIELNHSRIVFVLEYCQGPELSFYIKNNKCIEEKDAKGIIHQLFSALSYLTDLEPKVIHYDLKPSNIMFHRGIVKVLDFGLCKLMENQDSRMELTSQGTGTYWYLPPETFGDFQSTITAKVDVWSAGVIFYQMLYGKRPFANGIDQTQIYQRNLIQKTAKNLQFPLETPMKYRVSNEAKNFIKQCLAYYPDQRLSASEAYNHPYFKI